MNAFDANVVAQAEKVVKDAIAELLATTKRGAVVGVAPAGAGKSYAVCSGVLEARRAKRRVAVATPTNEQAFALLRELSRRLPRELITAVPAASVDLPNDCRHIRNIAVKKAREVASDGIVVGTLNKLGDAHARGDLRAFDVLLVDEAFQANAVHYYAVGDLAPRHLLMGDSGQLAPFTTAPEGDRWRGLDEDPLLTAIEALLRNHPHTTVHKLPITRRLEPKAMPVVHAFYPDHDFRPAVLPNVRKLAFGSSSERAKYRIEDHVLESAASTGWAYLELPDSAVVSADPQTVNLIVRLVGRLLSRRASVQCENRRRPSALLPSEIAVAVSHNDQKDLLRVALDDARLGDVVVNTANKLQGMTFEVVIAWHPLAGLTDIDEFHLDPGRLCVMLTRHRQACVVVGRASDRLLVRGIPPATPSYVGWDVNPALEGWYVHEAVFAALEPFRISAA